ncbi:MAG: MmgE/PrpD family protein [Ramlibacter sp.]
MEGLTSHLVDKVLPLRCADLPADVRRVARDCLVDWLACTYAGLSQPASTLALEVAVEEGGHPRSTFIGHATRGGVLQAALVNGTASHALDYDDVNLAVPGHMSVAIIPALLALAEERGSTGAQFIGAFVAGYETACRIGKLVEPAHYANGFHATATIGSIGAAVACSHLLQLSSVQACHAVGIAATQAAGLKSMFGTMTKPLHAGLAAQAGARAALLARKGFTSRTDALECSQGFAAVHGTDFHIADALAEPKGGYHLLANLFKFHAACYSTHSTIDALKSLRQEHSLQPGAVASVRVVAGEGCVICNVQAPSTALEAKFSLRVAAAFALLDIDTSGLDEWSRATEPDVIAMRDRVTVDLVPGMTLSDSEVILKLRDGSELRRWHDSGIPMADKAAQSERVQEKFKALATPVIGSRRSAEVLALLSDLEGQPDCRRVVGMFGSAAKDAS